MSLKITSFRQNKYVSVLCAAMLLLVVHYSNDCLGQGKPFTLVVIDSSARNDTLSFGEPYLLKQYNASSIKVHTAVKKGNQYIFSGRLAYPTAVRLYEFRTGYKCNELMFIDTGYQEVKLTVRDSKFYISEHSKTAIEVEHRNFLRALNTKTMDEEINPDSLYYYVKGHPNSYVAMFALINQTFNYNYGFHQLFAEIAKQFSPKITSTKGFVFYKKEYLTRKKIPILVLGNQYGKKVKFNPSNTSGKYTLLEFGFVGCFGCSVALDELKKLDEDHKLNNLRIVNIDVYSNPGIEFMKKINRNWESYWMLNEHQFDAYFTKLLLSGFPRRLLLDNTGTIIFKDIRIDQLPALLDKKGALLKKYG